MSIITASITCGNCKQKHGSVAEVKACYGNPGAVTYPVPDDVKRGLNALADAPARTEVTSMHFIKPGFYTIVFDETTDDRITFRVKPHWDDAGKARGEMVVGYLRGPENTKDYTNFAFLTPHGQHRMWSIWKRFRDGDTSRLERGLEVLHQDPATAGEAYAIRSSNCAMCGHTLTVPASVNRGLGPVCAQKEWY